MTRNIPFIIASQQNKKHPKKNNPNMGSGDKIVYLTHKNMRYILCLLVILLLQHRVQCQVQNEDETLIDHSNDEDRTHVNEWVIHVPKGKFS